jgi:phosphatidylserine synthase
LYVTWLVGRWPITANAVTAISLVVGGAAAILLAIPEYFVFGVAGLWCWYLLDHVDGQIARLRRSQSITGVYFDYMMHHLVHPAVAFALGYGLAQSTLDVRWSLAGAGFAFGIMALSLSNDCRYKAFFAASHSRILSVEQPREIATKRSGSASTTDRRGGSDHTDSIDSLKPVGQQQVHFAPASQSPGLICTLGKWSRSIHPILLVACEIPNVILCLTLIAVCLIANMPYAEMMLRAYVVTSAVIAPALAVLRLAKQVVNRLPDRDYHAEPTS